MTSTSGPLAPKSAVTLEVTSSSFVSGWAGLSGTGVTGQAVFHRHVIPTNDDYEGTVPLSGGGTEFLAPFDSTSFNGTVPYITGIAIVNLDAFNPALFYCTGYSATGTILGQSSLTVIQPQNHTAIALNGSSGFGFVEGKQGTLDCVSQGPQISILGLRFLGTNGITSFAPVKLQ